MQGRHDWVHAETEPQLPQAYATVDDGNIGLWIECSCSKTSCAGLPEVVSIAIEALLSLCPSLLRLHHLDAAQHGTA